MPSEIETAIRRTRRQIDTLEGPVRQEMADLYARAVRNLATDLDLVTTQIRSAQDAGIEVNPDWLRRQDRYTRLIGQAEREFARFTDDGVRLIESGRVRAIRGGAAEAWELLDAAGIERGFAANVPTFAIENAMSATYSGPVRRSLARYGEDGAQTIRDTLIDGMARGRGPRAIIRDIQRALLSPANAARLESLVRTEMMRGFRNGLNEQYAQVAHLIGGYRWSAAKSVRTCLACLARDGRVQKEPWDQFHVNCRCISSPVAIGSTFRYQTGEEWFAQQSSERQQRMMPSRQAWDAYRGGSVKLGDFVGVHRDRTWGSAVYQRSGRDVLGDGKPVRNVTPQTKTWGQSRHPKTFASNDAAREWADAEYATWNRYLANEERQALNRYKGGDHTIPNNFLRKPKGVIVDAQQGKQMADAIHRSQRTFKARGGTTQDIVTYRGIDREVFGDLLDGDLENLVGTVIRDKGFPSTSLSEDYVLGSRRDKGVIVETRVPKGSSSVSMEGSGVNTYGYDEYEMLLPKGSKMEIVGVEQEPDGFIRLITELR